MEIKKLKYLLKNQTTSLLADAGIFWALLSLGASGSLFFGLLWVIDLLYLKSKFFKSDTSSPTFLFWVFCAVSFFVLWKLNGLADFIAGLLIFILLFIFLAAQMLYFANPKLAIWLFFYMVTFGVVSSFASYFPANLWWGSLFALGTILFGIMLDFLKIETKSIDTRKKTYALVFALLASQCVWAASLLSIGFLNVAVVVLIFSITFGDLAVNHFIGHLTKKAIIRHALFFVVFEFIAFLASIT